MGGRREVLALHDRPAPDLVGDRGQHVPKPIAGHLQIHHDLCCRPSRPGIDVGVAFGATAGVLRHDLADNGGLQAANVGVGVAGQVGEHVPDGPSRQGRRATNVVVPQAGTGREESRCRVREHGQVAVRASHHPAASAWARAQA